MIERFLRVRRAKKQRDNQQKQAWLVNPGTRRGHYVAPWAVANSRRLKVKMPIAAKTPAITIQIWNSARPNSPQLIVRPLLNESIGEKSLIIPSTSSIPLAIGTATRSIMFG